MTLKRLRMLLPMLMLCLIWPPAAGAAGRRLRLPPM